jgi:hypothetical protein
MHFSLQMAGYDVAVSILLLLLIVVNQAAVPLTHSTLTAHQLHTGLCLWTVAHRHFTPGRSLVVSLTGTTLDVARHALSETLPKKDELQTANVILGKLHEGTKWPIVLFQRPQDDIEDSSVLHHSYVMFVWKEEVGSLNETLENQLENLKYSTSWKLRGRFLVVANESNNEPAHLLAAHICSVLWQVARIVNVVVLIANLLTIRPLHAGSNIKKQQLTG